MLFHDERDETWDVATGVLKEPTDGLVTFAGHIWASSPADGGFVSWLPSLNGKPLRIWSKDSDVSEELSADALMSANAGSKTPSDSVLAECDCGGVSFSISRPNEKSTQANPDLINPNSPRATDNAHREAWWLRANGTRYKASNCFCRSCRLATGFDVVQWAFIPAANLSLPDGQPFKLMFGTMQSYHSSHCVTRTWCGICGATVFFSDDKRPERIIDIAVGLLKASSGARAEELVEWEISKVSYEEDALNKDLVESLKGGLRTWGEHSESESHSG